MQAFKLADGKFVTKTAERSLVQVLSSKPYLTARATASDANLQNLLDAQVGTAKSAKYPSDNGDSYVRGHRAWLCTFVGNRIKLSEKMCDPSKAMPVRTLLDVTVEVR